MNPKPIRLQWPQSEEDKALTRLREEGAVKVGPMDIPGKVADGLVWKKWATYTYDDVLQITPTGLAYIRGKDRFSSKSAGK